MTKTAHDEWEGGDFYPQPIDQEQEDWLSRPAVQKASEAVEFAKRWRTWPKDGDENAALAAAVEELKRNPAVTPFGLAKVAIRAAEGRRR